MDYETQPSFLDGPPGKDEVLPSLTSIYNRPEVQIFESVDLTQQSTADSSHPRAIRDLYNCSVTSYKSLVKVARGSDRKTKSRLNIFRNEYQLLCLWGNDLDVDKGGLDRRLEKSRDLRVLTFSTLISLVKSILRCCGHKRIFENPELSVKSVKAKVIQAEDTLRLSKRFHRHNSTNNDESDDESDDENDDESDDESNDESNDESDDGSDDGSDRGEVEDFEDVLEDIKTYTRGLLDLTLSLESPAEDPSPRGLEASTPLMSPNAMHAGEPFSFFHAPSSRASRMSPPDSCGIFGDNKNKHVQRQFLPSIHEAFGNDNPFPYPASTSAPPPQSSHPTPPLHLIGRPSAEGPAGPPNPFSPTAPLMRGPGFSHQAQLQADAPRSSLISISTGKSPTQSTKTGITSIGSQNSSRCEYNALTSTGSVASPNGPAPYDNRPYIGAPQVEEVKGGFVSRPGPPYSDFVKRHLDVYDVETSLNEIAELSTRTLDFSRHYTARAYQTQRPRPLLGSLPSLNEVEEMLYIQRRKQDALIRIRTALVNQEQALAEQMAQRKALKTEDEHIAMYQEEFKGTGGFVGADTKKRRGKATPPGRCHSCNRAETLEWRRGPDGARTLCNACGLHYAKLTRKMGASKAASLGSSLKPKSVLDSASTTSH